MPGCWSRERHVRTVRCVTGSVRRVSVIAVRQHSAATQSLVRLPANSEPRRPAPRRRRFAGYDPVAGGRTAPDCSRRRRFHVRVFRLELSE